MQIGISGKAIDPGQPDAIADHGELAEELGFDLFTVTDSHCNKPELYTKLAVVAERTESINIGSYVTNPVTRHPTVTASAICTANVISGGRAVLGIATGDSAVRTIGERPAKLSQMEETIQMLQKLFRGEEIENGDDTIQLEWVDRFFGPQDVPILWAAEGPKTQRAAGKYADGVLMGLGLTPELIEKQVERINEGAASIGRDPDSVEKWVVARCNIDDDREQAIDDVRGSLASVAHHSLKFSLEGKFVPEQYHEAIQQITGQNLSRNRESKYQSHELISELGLRDYLAERYGVVGTPEDCIEKITKIQETGLVDGMMVSAPIGRKRNVISRFGNEVLPEL